MNLEIFALSDSVILDLTDRFYEEGADDTIEYILYRHTQGEINELAASIQIAFIKGMAAHSVREFENSLMALGDETLEEVEGF